MPDKIVPSSYQRLITDIAALYEGARRALIVAYWKIGQRIVEVEQQGAVKAAYGISLLPKLSQDLTRELGSGFSERQLREMRRFYLEHRIRPPAAELSWTQHVELLKIGDTGQRKDLERRAVREGLKRDELRELIHREIVREQVAENLKERSGSFSGVEKRCLTPLIPIRGTLYTYRITSPDKFSQTRRIVAGAKATAIQPQLLIDLGFSCYRDLTSATKKKFKSGAIVTSGKDAQGNYSLKMPSPNPLPGGKDKGEGALFTYCAEIEKVVDGDTLRVIVDLGFGIKTRQYLRLRGIDCSEVDTPEGKKAAEFVRSRIKQADKIVLTSSKSDKYDRYLADVYFTDSKGQEIYLNNLLLREGLAINMGE